MGGYILVITTGWRRAFLRRAGVMRLF